MSLPGARRHPDPYDLLGVSAGASQQDIVRAYRRAVQHAHPDTQPHDPQAAARFQALTDAYQLLSDPARRAGYDRENQAAGPGAAPPSRTGPAPGSRGPAPRPGPAGHQPIWAGPVQVEPLPAAGPQTGTPAAEHYDPPVILGASVGHVWSWPW